MDQLRKGSDEIEFYDIPLSNSESVMEETPIPNNIPKLSPPTESAHNQGKGNMSTESPAVTPSTQNVINKPNSPTKCNPDHDPNSDPGTDSSFEC